MDLDAWAAVQVGLAQHQPYLVGATDKTRAAVAVVLGPTPEGLQLLFIERAQHPDDLARVGRAGAFLRSTALTWITPAIRLRPMCTA